MTVPDRVDTWRKSTYSQQESACVEVALDPQAARVRDTKNRSAGHLDVSAQAWRSLLDRL